MHHVFLVCIFRRGKKCFPCRFTLILAMVFEHTVGTLSVSSPVAIQSISASLSLIKKNLKGTLNLERPELYLNRQGYRNVEIRSITPGGPPATCPRLYGKCDDVCQGLQALKKPKHVGIPPVLLLGRIENTQQQYCIKFDLVLAKTRQKRTD